MKIIIVGTGKLGEYLAKLLAQENNDVTVIDTNFSGKEALINNENVNYIEGNGLDSNVLIEAGIKYTDLLISSMREDSKNIVCSLLAKKLGAKNTIARIRDPEYSNSIHYISEPLGLSLSINPEQLTAMQIALNLSIPSAIDATTFLKGKIHFISVKIKENSKLKNLTIKNLINKNKIIVCAIERGNEVIIPDGETTILLNDKIHITGKREDLNNFLKFAGFINEKTKNVILLGGSKISIYLAKMLKEMDMNVKIIEQDNTKCKELSSKLDNVLIINANISNQDTLYEEGIEDCDAIVSLTDTDEKNIVYSMFASSVGVPKIITKINRLNLNGVTKKANIDTVIVPHKIVANHVVKYIRAMENSMSSSYDAIYKIGDDVFEIIEFKVKENFKFINRLIKDINFENDILIAAIQREENIIFPTGNDEIKLNDIILVINKCHSKKIKELNDIIK